MTKYYYEYVIPSTDSYNLSSTDSYHPQKSRKEKTNPDRYTVKLTGVVFSQDEKIADRMIKQQVRQYEPSYDSGWGVIMFSELPENKKEGEFCFSDDDWRERLQRATRSPDDTIIIHRES